MAIREGTKGNDRLIGTALADIMEGKDGNDVLFGLGGNDLVKGGAGNDLMYGGLGNDNMQGGLGADTIFGDAGNDILDGDKGNDIMNGGLGNDRFVFDNRDGNDRINGFVAGGTDDVLDFRTTAFNFTTFAQVLAHAHDVGTNVVIDTGGGDSVTLAGIHEAQLRTVDFIL
jgi:Ca2+-binding RTX toxin-like protein